MKGVVGRGRQTAVPRWRWGDEIAPLAEHVLGGGILAIPTESSYGLAVDPLNERAVAAVFALKGRSGAKPLPVVIAGPEQLGRLGVDWPVAAGGVESLWPAALSLLLPTRSAVAAAAGSGRLAVRVPGHEGLRRLLGELGIGLTATSANLAGAEPVLDPAALDALVVAGGSGDDGDAMATVMIVDDGVLAGGPPSTLVEASAGVVTIRRPGRVGLDALRAAATGLEVRIEDLSPAVKTPVEASS